jgi:hypothetical protein
MAPHLATPEHCIYVPLMGGSALEQAMTVCEHSIIMHQFCVAAVDVKCVESVQRCCKRLL